MEQDDWILEFKCHDEFESEYLEEGLETLQHPVKETYLQNAMMEATEFWTKIKSGEANPPKGREAEKDCYAEWGHFDPYLVSKNNPDRRIKLTEGL